VYDRLEHDLHDWLLHGWLGDGFDGAVQFLSAAI
jgi:hypothetical protein